MKKYFSPVETQMRELNFKSKFISYCKEKSEKKVTLNYILIVLLMVKIKPFFLASTEVGVEKKSRPTEVERINPDLSFLCYNHFESQIKLEKYPVLTSKDIIYSCIIYPIRGPFL